MIFTIGYQGLKPDLLREIVVRLDAVLIDCRSSTRSRIPGFGGRQLQTMLGERYLNLGHQLGGRTPIDPSAIEYLREEFDGEDNPDCVLMCMEHDPHECHRHHAITAPHFPEARHITQGRWLYRSADVAKAVAEDGDCDAVGELLIDMP